MTGRRLVPLLSAVLAAAACLSCGHERATAPTPSPTMTATAAPACYGTSTAAALTITAAAPTVASPPTTATAPSTATATPDSAAASPVTEQAPAADAAATAATADLALPDSGAISLSNPDVWYFDSLAMPHPHSLAVLGDHAFTVDAGEVLAIPLGGGQATRLAPPDGLVGSYVVGELVALCPAPSGDAILVLDKRGDVYRLNPVDHSWSIERLIDQRRSSPNPVYVDIAAGAAQLHILDSSHSQVWLHPAPEGGDAYLPGGDSPWERAGTSLDLTAGMALAVDGDSEVYVLLREGPGTAPGVAHFTGSVPARDVTFAADLDIVDPVALAVAPRHCLALIDRGGYRLRLLDADDGAALATWEVAAGGARLRAAAGAGERLYVAAEGALLVFPGNGAVGQVVGGEGPVSRPDSDQSLAAVARLASPIAGARFVPARDSLLPGATRVYRYGIHRGLDMYDGTTGVAIPYGATVLAAADGVVIRADVDFVEMSASESETVIAECERLHYTPDDLLDRLRGRQVWIDHGGGLVTRYVHLSAVAEGIQVGSIVVQGQAIGYVGNSGTSDGVAGGQSGAHLHFEVLIDGAYLGKWLSVPEVRRVLAVLLTT